MDPREQAKQIFQSLVEPFITPQVDIEPIVRRIERSCYNLAMADAIADGTYRAWNVPKFAEKYSAVCYKVLANINKDLVTRIINGNVDLENIAQMTSAELCPEASMELRQQITRRKEQKIEQKVSRSYQCSKCGNNETTVIEYQGRALDEASNYSIRCIICGHIWRK
jgi:DNA-directed RNA polymerase subunit M/transcription elongation factor TFIIS